MRAEAIFLDARDRLGRPGTWGAVLLVGCVWTLLHWAIWPGHGGEDGFLIPALVALTFVVGTPLPWQWTGDDRPLAPFPRGLLQAALASLVPAACILALLPDGPMAGWGMNRGMGHGPMSGGGMGRTFGPFSLTGWQVRRQALDLILVAAGLLAGRTVAVQNQERHRADEAERRGREAQARALQAQMNPHVLVNAISGLAELAHQDPAATEAALVRLADLFRRLLDHAGRTAAPLIQERLLVERLLDLEQFRLGDRLRVRWVWDAGLEHLCLPPLLLQPLVENAVRHGIAPERAGGDLEIGLDGTSKHLHLWVANTGRPYRKDPSEGIGLANLRQRLALMPPPAGRLDLRVEGGRTLAELHVHPLEAGHG